MTEEKLVILEKTGDSDTRELVAEVRWWRHQAGEFERAMGAGVDWFNRRLNEIVAAGKR